MTPNATISALSWVYAIAKAEGAVPRQPPDAQSLMHSLCSIEITPEAGWHLADFLERHKFEFVDSHRPAKRKQRLRRWALHRVPKIIPLLRANEAPRSTGPRLAVLLRHLKIEKLRGRPKVPSYLHTDTDVKFKIAAEEYRAQTRLLGVDQETALKSASEKHNVTAEGLRSQVKGKGSKRLR